MLLSQMAFVCVIFILDLTEMIRSLVFVVRAPSLWLGLFLAPRGFVLVVIVVLVISPEVFTKLLELREQRQADVQVH